MFGKKTWEYHQETIVHDRNGSQFQNLLFMDKCGLDGWELVSMQNLDTKFDNETWSDSRKSVFLCTYKRPK